MEMETPSRTEEYDAFLNRDGGPATQKQLDFLQILARKHDYGMDPDVFDALILSWVANQIATKRFISDQIDKSLSLPLRKGPVEQPKFRVSATGGRFATMAPRPGSVKRGFYKLEEEGELQFFRVVRTRDGERLYAKKLAQSPLDNWEWTYSPGSIGKLSLGTATKINEDDVQSWAYKNGGICPICLKIHSTGLPFRLDVKSSCYRALKKED